MTHSSARFLAATAALAVLPSLTTAAMAQSTPVWTDRSYNASFNAMVRQRAEATRGAPSADAAAGARVLAGVALVHGYDSNRDLDAVGADGGSFGLIDAGVGALWTRADSETALLARGSYSLNDIDFRPERWDAGVLVDHHQILADDWRVTMGGFFIADNIEVDRNNSTAGYVQLNHDTAVRDVFLRLRSLYRGYLDDVGTLKPNGDLIEVDRTFSNVRTEASAGVLMLKDQRLAPYLQAGVASIDFNRQANEAVLDRDGREVWGIAGVRISLTKDLKLDVGARTNHRAIDDNAFSSHSSTWFDGRLVWSPGDWLYVELNVDRTFETPEVANALLGERTAAQLYARAQLSDRLSATMFAGLVHNDQIGTNRELDEEYVDIKLDYALSERMQVFGLAGAARWRDSDDADAATRVRVGMGLKYGY